MPRECAEKELSSREPCQFWPRQLSRQPNEPSYGGQQDTRRGVCWPYALLTCELRLFIAFSGSTERGLIEDPMRLLERLTAPDERGRSKGPPTDLARYDMRRGRLP